MRLRCRAVGCKWVWIDRLPEEDSRWDRNVWRCLRCGDVRPIWVGYEKDRRPDRFYE